MTSQSDAIVWRADAEDGGSVWVHANGEWGYEGGTLTWAFDALAKHVAKSHADISRGGAMTAEALEAAFSAVDRESMSADAEAALAQIRSHSTAQGARIAELEGLTARGGTMTAQKVEDLLVTIGAPMLDGPERAQRLREHCFAQGARNAALEAENIEMRRLLSTRVEASRLDEANAELGKAWSDRDAWREKYEGFTTTLESAAGLLADDLKTIEDATSALVGAIPTRCCERDSDGDGNCDRHPAGFVARLQQHISDLEKSLEQARQSEKVWKERMEKAADALSDVLPGEAGRLDLLSRIAELKRLRAGYGKELTTYIRTGVEVAEILDGGKGFLGEGIVEGAKRVVKERDAAVAAHAALLASVNEVLNFVHCHSPDMGGNHRYSLTKGHGPAVARLQALAAEPHSGTALLEKHRSEIEAVKADNAVLLKALLSSLEVPITHDLRLYVRSKFEKEPHPGSALLEEVETLRGVRAQAQVDAKFIHEALGWAGEWPSSLPAPSRAVVALLERVKRLEEALLRHGDHAHGCALNDGNPCSCGWMAIEATLGH